MSSWELKTIGEVCEILDNKRKPITKRNRMAGDVPYYGATGILDYVEGFLFDEELVLLGEDGAKWGSGERSSFKIEGKTWVNNHAHVLRPNKLIVTDDWVVYNLNYQNLMPFVSGMTVPKLNQGTMRKIQIPVPPLPEQKRIVAILDEAFAAIDQAQANIERNIENAEELFQSKLEAVFSERGEGWEEKKLGEACKISMGQSPKGSTYNYERIGTPLINGPVEFGQYPFSETVMAKWTTEPKKMCKKGDLILCVRGSTTGRINIAGFEACIGRGVALIRYDENQKWLNYFIRPKQDYIYSLGSGSTFPNVSGKILNEIEFPEPPIEVQNSLIEVMDNLVENTNQILLVFKTKLQNINELKKSLLQKAFSGELTAKDGVA